MLTITFLFTLQFQRKRTLAKGSVLVFAVAEPINFEQMNRSLVEYGQNLVDFK